MANSHTTTPVAMTNETMKTHPDSAAHLSSTQTTPSAREQAAEQVTTGPTDIETANAGAPIVGSPSAINVKLPPSTTSVASQSSNSKEVSLPHPGHYLRRSDGTITPLIAVDELPTFLHIVGVSRSLTRAQTQDMISLGTLPKSSKLYTVQMVDPQSEIGDDGASVKTIEIQATSSRASDATSVKGDRSRKESVKRWVQGVSQEDDTQSAIDAVIAANTPGKLDYKPISPGVFGGKVYCTHWVRTGECDFTQQGCIFRHEMPDEKTLAKMGFRHIPRWFREAGGFDEQVHDVPLARDINEDWRPGTGRGRPRHNTNPATVFGRGINQQFTGNVFPVPSFAQSRPVFNGVPGFAQPRTRMSDARWPGVSQPTNAPHQRPFPQQPRNWTPPQHVVPNMNSAVGFPTRFNPGPRHQPSVSQTQTPALSNPRPPTFLPDDRTLGGSNMSSAASTTSDYSAMTMSAFAPPGGQAPGLRHRQQGTPVRSFQPLTPAPAPAPAPQQPVTANVQARPQPQPQSSKAGELFAGAPVAPPPQHRRMFQPPPAPLPKLVIPTNEPKPQGQGNGKGKGNGKSKAVPIVQPKGPKRDDKGGPKDDKSGGKDGKGLVDL